MIIMMLEKKQKQCKHIFSALADCECFLSFSFLDFLCRFDELIVNFPRGT